jgi:hypothetical protein
MEWNNVRKDSVLSRKDSISTAFLRSNFSKEEVKGWLIKKQKK